ncbi:ABC transporter substrate-binding protein [Methylobacterium sp. CM6246]
MRTALSLQSAILSCALLLGGYDSALAQGVLRIGMTASDIPLTTGQTDNGGEGIRFVGQTIYDALIAWDLTHSDKPAELIPGLAVSWAVDPVDRNTWTFRIRPDVKFHDGSDFTAYAAVWNFDKLLKPDAPQFDPRQSAQGKVRIPAMASYRAIDRMTLEVVTKTPDATLPYQLVYIAMSSPAQWEKVGRSWDAFAKQPSGTGPWKLTLFAPRERAEMVPHSGYWDKARVPKLDRLVLVPLPDANARVAALRSGQVDWIEAPSPDAVASLRNAGFAITTNSYPHNWTWHLSRIEGSPWNDIRVRKAVNLAIDREGLKELLGGLAVPATGFLPPHDAWFGTPSFQVKYDPNAARKLLAEAGYSPAKPLRTKIAISASGSGQMQPLPMNEFIQQNLADVGVKVEYEVVEWNTLINIWRVGAKADISRGVSGINYSYSLQDPYSALIRHLKCDLTAPAGTNWGYYCDPAMDKMLDEVRNTFDPDRQVEVMGKIHEKFVDDALFVMVTHDVNPRAMSPRVKGFVQAQSWNQSLTPVYLSGSDR